MAVAAAGVPDECHHSRIGFGLLVPIGERDSIRKELVDLGLRDAGFAAPVHFASVTGDDVVDDGLGGVVRAGIAGMMPSPLKFVAAKILAVSPVSAMVISVAADLPRFAKVCLADARSCLPSGVVSLIAASGNASPPWRRSSGFFRFAQAHWAAAMISGTRIAPVFVGVNELQGLRVELQPGRRAGQRNPKFLIELIEIRDVRAGGDFDLVEPARAEEFPSVCDVAMIVLRVFRSSPSSPQNVQQGWKDGVVGGAMSGNGFAGEPSARSDNLTRDERILRIGIHRAQAMVAVGNDDLPLRGVAHEQQRGKFPAGRDFFRSASTCELLTPSNDKPDARKISFALNVVTRAAFNRATNLVAVGDG